MRRVMICYSGHIVPLVCLERKMETLSNSAADQQRFRDRRQLSIDCCRVHVGFWSILVSISRVTE